MPVFYMLVWGHLFNEKRTLTTKLEVKLPTCFNEDEDCFECDLRSLIGVLPMENANVYSLYLL